MTTTQQKTALITGITGQDGSYLAEFLLEKGYIVHGIKRRAPDFAGVAPSRRGLSAPGQPAVHSQRGHCSRRGRHCRAVNYRETFVTRKITRGLANISQGLEDCLFMGNIDALRDWGHAKDYVRMQWMMLQQDKPDDFVIATGVQYSVRSFLEWTATALGMQLRWEGTGVNEVGYAVVPGASREAAIVRIDPRYFRPTEVETLLGDPTKAKQKLGWVPEITAQEMCAEMVAHDLAEAKKHALLRHHGYNVNVSVE